MLFTRQLHALYKAGISIPDCLESLRDGSDYPQLADAVSVMSSRISTGESLSEAMHLFPRIFSPMYVTLIRIGERTGSLERCLDRLSSWLERDLRVRRRLAAMASYPLFVVAITSLLTIGLLCTFLPRFITIFEELDVTLPLPTRILMGMASAATNPWAWVGGALTLTSIGLLFHWYVDRARLAVELQRLLWRLPLVGPVLRHAALARFCAAAQVLLSSGIDLLSTLRLAAAAGSATVLAGDSDRIAASITRGRLLSHHMLSRTDLYGETIPHLLSVAEQTGRMDEMFGRCSDFCQADMEHRVDGLMAAAEPLMLFCVASLVGFIVIAVFLPLYSAFGRLVS